MTSRTPYLLALGLAVGSALLLVLSAGALGILGPGGRPDRVYVVVLVVLALGSAAARLRARPMVAVLLLTALAQVLVTAVALLGEIAPAGTQVGDVVAVNALFAGLFAASAWLFSRSAGGRALATAAR